MGKESIWHGTVGSFNSAFIADLKLLCYFRKPIYKYTYNRAGLVEEETAKECLFASDKDYGHKGSPEDPCVHMYENPWNNQNPEWETTKRKFTYDDNGQMLSCVEDKGLFDKATYTYKYDEAGNRTLAKKVKLYSYLESFEMNYTYNEDNQMISAKVREGNLTKNYTFTYDANGNLTHECFHKQAEVVYQYDTENRLKAVYDKQKLLMAATYDGDGNRAFQLNYNPDAKCGYGKNVSGEIFMPEHSENEDGSLTAEGELFGYICSATGRAYDLTEYVNDINRQYTEVLTAYTVNSGATESYSYAGRQRLSRNNIWTEARDVVCNTTSYYLYDGRGSVTANTWYNGMVTNVYQYDPYGQVTLGSTEHTDFYGYNAESYNPNTGLEYLRARYYNANMGRFFQEDTYLGDMRCPVTLNRYAYVKNSPYNFIDPSGESLQDIQEGDEAHRSLQAFLKLALGELIETEYRVKHHPTNPSGTGKVDIVFHGPFGDEIYEIKPGGWSVNGTHLNTTGRTQRDEYIIAMNATYREKKGTNEAVPVVNPMGQTLFPVLHGLILPSIVNPNVFIKYYVYVDQPGMIYHSYGTRQEAMEYTLALETVRAQVLSQVSECQIGEDRTSVGIPGIELDPNLGWKTALGGAFGILLGILGASFAF